MWSDLLRFLSIRRCRGTGRAPGRLTFLLLWITDACNLRCRMCGDRWRTETVEGPASLALDDWRAVVDSARRLRTKVVSVTGGEPLLHPGVFEILGWIRDAGIVCNLCTNGSLLTSDRVGRLVETGIRSTSVSLDGTDPQTHNGLRGTDCFDATCDGIRRLREAMPRLQITINFTLSRVNFRQMSGMVLLGKELGVDKINLAPVHLNLQHQYRPEDDFEDLVFKADDIPALEEELSRARQAARHASMRISSAPFMAGIPRFCAGERWHVCYAGYVACAVSPWGSVSPCANFESDINVRDMPLHEIWRSDAFRRLRGKADLCDDPCWDTTNAEMAIRCSVPGVLREFPQLVKDLRVYGRRAR